MRKLIFAILFVILFPSFVWADSSIVADSYQKNLSVQNGDITIKEGQISVKSKSKETILLMNTGKDEMIDKISFENTDYPQGSVVFIWKMRNVDFDQKNQIILPINEGTVFLPKQINLTGFDFVGVVFYSDNISFKDILFSNRNIADNWNQFWEPQLIKPSTINLLYSWQWGDISVIKIFGILSIILFLSLYRIDKRWAFGVLFGLWILLDLRYT